MEFRQLSNSLWRSKRTAPWPFCVIKVSVIVDFLHYINGISPTIKFTVEIEENCSLAFLDVKVSRNLDNTLWTNIYQKPTHTNRYLQFDSHHSIHQKLAVSRSLYNRLDTHVSNPDGRRLQCSLIKNTLALNGFPMKHCNYQSIDANKPIPISQPPAKSFTTLPYIKGVSDKIKRVLNGVGVKVALKPLLTIGKFLPSLRDPLVAEEKSCLVYQVPCKDCSFIYIGQTKRDLKSRVSEHQRAMKFQRLEKSALCEHSILLNHTINWSAVEILKTETDYSKRLFAGSSMRSQK